MAHQLRLVKKDIKYGNPEGDVLEFLTRLKGLYKQHYRADKIEDPHTRKVAANCLDSMMRELMHGEWKDDEAGTIARYVRVQMIRHAFDAPGGKIGRFVQLAAQARGAWRRTGCSCDVV